MKQLCNYLGKCRKINLKRVYSNWRGHYHVVCLAQSLSSALNISTEKQRFEKQLKM